MKEQPRTGKKEENAGALVPAGQFEETTPAQYLNRVKQLIAARKPKEAFSLIQQAHIRYPKDPYVLSYYGWLQATVDKRYRGGVESCSAALSLLQVHAARGRSVRYGVVYANLAKAYLVAGKRKDAVEVLEKGLKHESTSTELLRELEMIGRRKKPPVAFLDRSNLINKYLGIIRHKLK